MSMKFVFDGKLFEPWIYRTILVIYFWFILNIFGDIPYPNIWIHNINLSLFCMILLFVQNACTLTIKATIKEAAKATKILSDKGDGLHGRKE